MPIKLLIALFLGELWQQKINSKSQKPKTITEKKQKEKHSQSPDKITKKYSTLFKVRNKSDKPITANDISININKSPEQLPENKANQHKKTEKPNFIPLAIFWAHFQAYQQDLLQENIPLPWEIHKNDNQNTRWIQFLNNILKKDWPHWINDEQEVKKRALKAAKKLNK